jgi:hypothetical protein
MKKLVPLLALLVGLSYSIKADPSIDVYISNGSYSSTRVYEFDIMIVSSGSTTEFELRTFQTGLYLNPAWVNGGVISAQNVSTYSEMQGEGYNGAFQWNPTDNLLNCSVNLDVIDGTNCISTPVLTTPIIVTRIRLTNSVDYPCLSPEIRFNYVMNENPLRLRTSFSWREVACLLNYDMFYPGRIFTGTAEFNGEIYSSSDVDGRSPVNTSSNPACCFDQLTVTALIEGFYAGNGQLNTGLLSSEVWHAQNDQADSITVELRSVIDPAILVAKYISILSVSGVANCLFPDSLNLAGNSYWIVLKHRNAIETWSAAPVQISNSSSYNFTSAQSQAYGNNLIQTGDQMGWALISGDISDPSLGAGYQDGIIESQDYADMENAVYIISTGYVIEDLTGDGIVESSDYALIENNVYTIASSQHP